ncbi:DNA polymerase, partial [Arthrospira platensis SPKY1]|nr:DNA polymerase [Arthrospira platensis SPKY1]
AKPGHVLLSADYSQVELRIIAAIAGDVNMIEAFRMGEDIHARTAKEIFHLQRLEEVTADQRRKAKEVNFGIPYGVSAFGLAQRLGIPNAEAKEMIDRYFARFPQVKAYMHNQVEYAREHGYVKTHFGRKR